MEHMLKIAQDNDIPIVDMPMYGKEGAMSQCIDGMCIIAIDTEKSRDSPTSKRKRPMSSDIV